LERFCHHDDNLRKFDGRSHALTKRARWTRDSKKLVGMAIMVG
jgi:hypothetical protein